jgi:hypothetical protein
VADSYLKQLRSEMAWTRRAVEYAAPSPAYWSQLFRERSPEEQIELLRRIGREWVRRQAHYFHRRFHEKHRAAARLRQFGFVSAFTGWLIVTALLITLGFRQAPDEAATARTESPSSTIGNAAHPAGTTAHEAAPA